MVYLEKLQEARFGAATRTQGVDEPEDAFREKLAMIARHKAEPEKAPEPKRKEAGQ